MAVRIQVIWTGLAGASWLQQLNFDADAASAQSCASQVGEFLTSMKPFLDTEVSYTTGADAIVFDESTGEVTSDVAITPQAGTGTESNDKPLPGNVCLNLALYTGVRRAGRSIIGHIFLPGVSGNALNNQGQWSTAVLNQATTAADAFDLSGDTSALSVYSRPGALVEHPGLITPVTAILPRAVTASLRSRRQ